MFVLIALGDLFGVLVWGGVEFWFEGGFSVGWWVALRVLSSGG